MLAIFWLVLIVFVQNFRGVVPGECDKRDTARLFECSLVLTESYTMGNGIDAVENLINILSKFNRTTYRTETCNKFWKMYICARMLRFCVPEGTSSAVLNKMNNELNKAFGLCSGLNEQMTSAFLQCWDLIKEGTCTQHLTKDLCSLAYYECIADYVRRECIDLSTDARKLLCYLLGWTNKKVCMYQSICTKPEWNSDRGQSSNY